MFRQMTEAHINDLHCKWDEESGLQSVIAIHSTLRGPALGGCRIIPYSSAQEAIDDSIRLARGMSYKAALAGLNLGGGKAVIIEPEEPYDRHLLFQAFGEFVDELNGRYVTAMDSGTSIADMDAISTKTKHVTCTTNCGNPATYTAEGVYYGILASIQSHPDLPNSLKDLKIAIQGLGNVGYALCQLLHKDGAKLIVSDIDPDRVTTAVHEFKATVEPPEKIHATPCDLFSPCGLGGILNSKTIGELQCAVVAGSANNQLQTDEDSFALLNRNILYAPDYLINAGGLIFVAMSYWKSNPSDMHKQVHGIRDTLLQIYERQNSSGLPGSIIADQMAEAMLNGDQDIKKRA